MKAEYYCPKCALIVDADQFSKDKFCPRDGTHLRPHILRIPSAHPEEIQKLLLSRDQINVQTLYREFLNLRQFNPGEGIVFDDCRDWLTQRAQAYERFRKEFTPSNLTNQQKATRTFSDFLHFKHNFSWTTLYRTGTQALQDPKGLLNLLLSLQDESLDVATRVEEALTGKIHVEGIGRNIATAILHVCDSQDKYGVWNSRTEDTLGMLRRIPPLIGGPGHVYVLINRELNSLKKELETNLLTVDSFMWYVSKRVQIPR